MASGVDARRRPARRDGRPRRVERVRTSRRLSRERRRSSFAAGSGPGLGLSGPEARPLPRRKCCTTELRRWGATVGFYPGRLTTRWGGPGRAALQSPHGADLLGHPGRDLDRPDLPGAYALREGRRAVRRVRGRDRPGTARRRLARRAQPEPLDGRLRDRVRREHDPAPQGALGLTTPPVTPGATVRPVMRKPPARSAGHTMPLANRRP